MPSRSADRPSNRSKKSSRRKVARKTATKKSTKRSPGPARLYDAPLAEAIFELRWNPPAPDAKDAQAGPDLAAGRFFEQIRTDFGHAAQLPGSGRGAARLGFRPAPGEWPLVQLGPDMLFLNDLRGYTWSSFRATAERLTTALAQTHPGSAAPNGCALRYVNTVAIDAKKPSLVEFLRDQLHTSLSVDPAIFDDPSEANEPTGLDFSMTFPLKQDAGFGTVSFATGFESEKPVLVWQLEARAIGGKVPELGAIMPWLDDAHDVLLRWFQTLGRGELMESFTGGR